MNAIKTVLEYIPAPATHSDNLNDQKVIVIGSGPVGMRFVQQLLKLAPMAQVTLFGNEPYQPYNRVQLSALLAGEVKRENIDIPLPNFDQHPNFSFVISTIRQILKQEKTLVDAQGKRYSYDLLVMATGARAHIPHVPGVDQKGIYTFRNLKDAESLYARIASSRNIVVVGGGLLGLEAARGLSRLNTKITLIHQGPHLMNRQLDGVAAEYLLEKVTQLGIKVITNSGVREIHGAGQVKGVKTRSGEKIDCDTVLLCTGIQPNIALARDARLKVSKGILVDDYLRTSDSGIFAIGECCEHRGITYGLVAPGYEQADAAASFIVSSVEKNQKVFQQTLQQPLQQTPQEKYVGSLTVSRLKVLGENVCSMGEVVNLPKRPFQSELTYRRKSKGLYRKVVTYKGLIIGAAGVGLWPDVGRIQTAYQAEHPVLFWQKILFRLIGSFWITQSKINVLAWPSNAIVCQCNGISQGQLVELVNTGCDSFQGLQNKTTAGTVCGSCKPLLLQLVGGSNVLEKEKDWPLLLVGSMLACVAALLLILVSEPDVSPNIQTVNWFELIWNDKFWKQVTGFTLVGLSVVGLLMSLRKRLGFAKLGSFALWRVLHIFLGAACAALLVFHTGFHLGNNLNQLLMLNFLGVLLMGVMAGWVVALSHKLSPSSATSLRKLSTWLHILVTWPLPVLLSMHILSVYYF